MKLSEFNDKAELGLYLSIMKPGDEVTVIIDNTSFIVKIDLHEDTLQYGVVVKSRIGFEWLDVSYPIDRGEIWFLCQGLKVGALDGYKVKGYDGGA